MKKSKLLRLRIGVAAGLGIIAINNATMKNDFFTLSLREQLKLIC